MTDEEPKPAADGAHYRVKAEHPRGARAVPFVVSTGDRRLILEAGDTCERATQAELDSLIANGYVERIDGGDTAPGTTEEAPQS
jgi:hypothetical protein